MRPIRTAAKAIIIEDGMLLVTENRDDQGVFYLLPGGGQEPGETLPEALVRECAEELCCRVEVEDLVLVRDYIAANHEFSVEEPDMHHMEFMFRCTLADGAEPCSGPCADNWQIGVRWLPLSDLHRHRLYPAAMVEPLRRLADSGRPGRCYLGDVN